MADPDSMAELGPDLSPADASAPRTRRRTITRDGVVLIVFVIVGAFAAFAIGPGHILAPRVHPGIPAPANATIGGTSTGPKLLIRLDLGPDDYGIVGRHVADYLSDGTVIRWTIAGSVCQPGLPCGTLERNTLTAAGLATLRALLTKDADLLATSRVIKRQILSGKTLVPMGDTIDTFVLEQPDGGRYTVSVPSTNSPNASAWVPDPAIERMNALADAMVDPATLVGAAGLTNPAWETYQPDKTAVFIRFTEVAPQFVPKPTVDKNGTISIPFGPPDLYDLDTTGWPFEGTPDTFGGSFTPNASRKAINGATYRCAFVPSADALAAIASLPKSLGSSLAAGEVAAGGSWRGGTIRWSGKSPTTAVSLVAVALLPEDVGGSCAGAWSY